MFDDMGNSNMGDWQAPSSSGSRTELRKSNTYKINKETAQQQYFDVDDE